MNSLQTLTRACSIVLLTILAIALASCTLIPGGKECNATINHFMLAASAKDIDTAYIFIDGAESDRKDLEEFIYNSAQLFEGYQEVKIREISVHLGGNENETAEYSGTVTYTDGFNGWVDAELVKVGELWKISWINIEISQEKLNDYDRKHNLR